MPRWVFMLSFSVILHAAAFAGATDEQVLYNGKIFTGEPDHPYAAAVAIKGDKIVAVGNRNDVAKAVTSAAEMIDLKGHLLLPGLIDSHCHAVDGGLSLISAVVDENLASIDQLAAFAADAKKTGRGMQGDILVVSGIPLAFWSKNKELNDRFSAGEYVNQPVLLEGMDGHTAWANKALLKRAGIDKQLIGGLDSVGRGYYGFRPDLVPNGFLTPESRRSERLSRSPMINTCSRLDGPRFATCMAWVSRRVARSCGTRLNDSWPTCAAVRWGMRIVE